MHDHWIAQRMRSVEVSGIRRVFDLARSLKDPVNLSIGVPHFDVPAPVKAAAIDAIRRQVAKCLVRRQPGAAIAQLELIYGCVQAKQVQGDLRRGSALPEAKP